MVKKSFIKRRFTVTILTLYKKLQQLQGYLKLFPHRLHPTLSMLRHQWNIPSRTHNFSFQAMNTFSSAFFLELSSQSKSHDALVMECTYYYVFECTLTYGFFDEFLRASFLISFSFLNKWSRSLAILKKLLKAHS